MLLMGIMEKFFMFCRQQKGKSLRRNNFRPLSGLELCVYHVATVCELKFNIKCNFVVISRFKYGFSLKLDREIMFADADKIG